MWAFTLEFSVRTLIYASLRRYKALRRNLWEEGLWNYFKHSQRLVFLLLISLKKWQSTGLKTEGDCPLKTYAPQRDGSQMFLMEVMMQDYHKLFLALLPWDLFPHPPEEFIYRNWYTNSLKKTAEILMKDFSPSLCCTDDGRFFGLIPCLKYFFVQELSKHNLGHYLD